MCVMSLDIDLTSRHHEEDRLACERGVPCAKALVEESTVDKPQAGRDRHAQMQRLIGEMESVRIIAEGQFSAVGMLVTDASLASDGPALEAAQDGLQWLCSRQEALT